MGGTGTSGGTLVTLCDALAPAGRLCLLTFFLLGGKRSRTRGGRRGEAGLLNGVRAPLKSSSDLSPAVSIHQVQPVLFMKGDSSASCQILTGSSGDVTK